MRTCGRLRPASLRGDCGITVLKDTRGFTSIAGREGESMGALGSAFAALLRPPWPSFLFSDILDILCKDVKPEPNSSRASGAFADISRLCANSVSFVAAADLNDIRGFTSRAGRDDEDGGRRASPLSNLSPLLSPSLSFSSVDNDESESESDSSMASLSRRIFASSMKD